MADFDYSTLLPLVDVLLKDNPPECNIRTAANRVYYSAYGSLRKRIVTESRSDCFDGQGFHGVLVNICDRATGSRPLQKIGLALKALLRLREQADYHWNDAVEVNRVRTEKTNAGRLIGNIAALREQDIQMLYREIQLAADRHRK